MDFQHKDNPVMRLVIWTSTRLKSNRKAASYRWNIPLVCCVLFRWGPISSGYIIHVMPAHGSFVKLRVAHAPGMPGTFSPPSRVSDPDMHQDTCVPHVPQCMPGSLTCGFLWSWWRGKRFRHSRPMRNPLFYVSGKRPMPAHAVLRVTSLALGQSYRI